jgi:dihydrofolate reductase
MDDRKRRDEMGKTVMGAVVSLDGFIADDNDDVGPLFDWYGNGDVTWAFDGVEEAIAAAEEFAGDQVVDVAAGQIGSHALKLGLIDQVVVNQVPVVFGSGRPFFATGGLAEPLRLENPTTIVPGDRVTHLVYDVSR